MRRLLILCALLSIGFVAGCGGGSSTVPTRLVGAWSGNWTGTLFGFGTNTYPMTLTIAPQGQTTGKAGSQIPAVMGFTGSTAPNGQVTLQATWQDPIAPAVARGAIAVNAAGHIQGTITVYSEGHSINQGNIDLTRTNGGS